MKPVAKVIEICNANRDKTRKEILALCEAAGVHKGTAATTYARWKREIAHQHDIKVYDQINYDGLRQVASSMGETNDCSVKALSIVTQTDYRKVHAMLAERGRKKGKGSYIYQYMPLLDSLGYDYFDIQVESRTVKTVELELSRKYPGTKALVWVRGHIAAFNGRNIDDWSAGRQHRVQKVVLVVPRDK